jgi:hypothetical protein
MTRAILLKISLLIAACIAAGVKFLREAWRENARRDD